MLGPMPRPAAALGPPLARKAGEGAGVRPRVLAELTGAAWEVFSSLLFISAVLPEVAFASFTPLIFFGGLAASAAVGPTLTARGARGYDLAAFIRARWRRWSPPRGSA
jgi:hypothetical protein